MEIKSTYLGNIGKSRVGYKIKQGDKFVISINIQYSKFEQHLLVRISEYNQIGRSFFIRFSKKDHQLF